MEKILALPTVALNFERLSSAMLKGYSRLAAAISMSKLHKHARQGDNANSRDFHGGHRRLPTEQQIKKVAVGVLIIAAKIYNDGDDGPCTW